MAKPIIYLDNLDFVDNPSVALAGAGVVVLVGPNNVGKTTALMELQTYLNEGRLMHNQRENSIFTRVSTVKTDESGFNAWMEQHIDSEPPEPIRQPTLRRYRNWGTQMVMQPQDAYTRFAGGPAFGELNGFLTSSNKQGFLEGEVPDFYAEGQGGNKQFEQFYLDKGLESKLSKLSETAFQTPVSLSRVGKRAVLHYGQIPKISEHPTREEIAALKRFPKVSEQGEGVRTLILLAQSMSLGDEPIVFMDEPEAHLHPPQAKLAGKYVAERGKRSQVFVATHSVDFLLGLLTEASVNVTIIRLDRIADNKLKTATLSGTDLSRAWSDPIVRYSRALSGLMHRGVVICESDGDCLYYEIVLDYLRNEAGLPAHDLLFIHGGGKTGAKKVLPALRKLSVPVCVITDFDVLRVWSELKVLYEKLGGNAADIQADWREVDGQLRTIGETRKTSDLQVALNDLASQYSPNATFSKDHSDQIKKIAKVKNGWDDAKNQGINALTGNPHRAAKRVLAKLAEYGLLVCPTGELESFHRDAPAGLHGSSWVTHVIDNELYKQLESPATEFIKSIPDHCVNKP